MKKLKRALYLTHRWFGVALCLIFALWFASGIVMMYVEYPELTEEERINLLPAIDLNTIQVDIDTLQNEILRANQSVSQFVLTSLFGRPVYQLHTNNSEIVSVFADSGAVFSNLTTEQAVQSAAFFEKGTSPRYIREIDMDQWTVSGALNIHRPLHKVALNNNANSFVYVSSLTGQIVRDTHGWERTWNWLGSTIHWVYPMQLRRHPGLWTDVIIYLSLLGILSVITGTIVGFLRVRIKNRYKSGSVTPYQGMQKWHHLLGLICVVFVATFLVSGLFSMNPWGIFDNKTSPLEQIGRYQGSEYSLNGLQQELTTLQANKINNEIKEIHWQFIGGKGVLIAGTIDGRYAVNMSEQNLDARIRESIATLIPNELTQIETLNQYDNYYYSTHNRYRPLPVYRAIFSDPADTWFYIDSQSGELLGRSTSTDRVERWLYNGLHSLDFQFLLAYRPLWDIVVIVLSIAGLLFCWTSIMIAWRRLIFKRSRKKAAQFST